MTNIEGGLRLIVSNLIRYCYKVLYSIYAPNKQHDRRVSRSPVECAPILSESPNSFPPTNFKNYQRSEVVPAFRSEVEEKSIRAWTKEVRKCTYQFQPMCVET